MSLPKSRSQAYLILSDHLLRRRASASELREMLENPVAPEDRCPMDDLLEKYARTPLEKALILTLAGTIIPLFERSRPWATQFLKIRTIVRILYPLRDVLGEVSLGTILSVLDKSLPLRSTRLIRLGLAPPEGPYQWQINLNPGFLSLAFPDLYPFAKIAPQIDSPEQNLSKDFPGQALLHEKGFSEIFRQFPEGVLGVTEPRVLLLSENVSRKEALGRAYHLIRAMGREPWMLHLGVNTMEWEASIDIALFLACHNNDGLIIQDVDGLDVTECLVNPEDALSAVENRTRGVPIPVILWSKFLLGESWPAIGDFRAGLVPDGTDQIVWINCLDRAA